MTELFHKAAYPWQVVYDDKVFLRVRADAALPIERVLVIYGDPFWFEREGEKQPVLKESALERTSEIGDRTYYTITLSMRTKKLRYHFEILLSAGERRMLTERGLTEPLPEELLRPFFVTYTFAGERQHFPAWAQNLVWYQIFPDRFSRGNGRPEDPAFVPDREAFYGGTLDGIAEKISYLKDLGVEGVYLNPIFASPSNHRYDTLSYERIDERLGNGESLGSLVDALHKAGLRVMLDGVFNHASYDHPFWQDVLERGQASPYYDWFDVGDLSRVRALGREGLTSEVLRTEKLLECFAFSSAMPKWRTEHLPVIIYLTEQAVAWTKRYEIDAWRLDVPDEVSRKFLQHFSDRMREIRPDIYVIGEIWQDPRWWIENAYFSGVMDYTLYFLVRDFAAKHVDSLATFGKRLVEYLECCAGPVAPYQFGFCSNHDVPRVLYACAESPERALFCYFLTVLFGGSISLYYGDELLISGGDDPENRRAMAWERATLAEVRVFRERLTRLLQLKKTVLRNAIVTGLSDQSGEVLTITLQGGGSVLIARISEQEYELTDAAGACLFFGKPA